MKPLRVTLGFHLLLFLTWAIYLLNAHRGAREIWLETAPVDPRDLISGHYVALDFTVANISNQGCGSIPSEMGNQVFVHLQTGARTVPTPEGVVRISEVKECRRLPPPDASGELWLKGTLVNSGGNRSRISYGIDRFYVSEKSLLRYARSGEVIAKVAVNRHHQARILDLVKIKK